MDFKKIVLFSALILLIVVLILVGVSLSYAKTSTWPPMVPKCPDFWIAQRNENDETVCVDVKNLAEDCPRIDGQTEGAYTFNTNYFYDDCARYKWATDTCKLAWDGISYGYGVKTPCEEKETETKKI
jgi:hypothetical protein